MMTATINTSTTIQMSSVQFIFYFLPKRASLTDFHLR